MKTRVNLTGGIPLKSLRIYEIRDEYSDEVFETAFPDTWPIEDLLHDIYSQHFESDFDILASSLQFLSRSNIASALIHDAAKENWEIGFSALEGAEFHIDVPEGKIILNNEGMTPEAISKSTYFRHAVLSALLRALRDVWQEKRHGGFDEKFGPEGVLLLERARSADCETIAVLAAWEIRACGYADLWKHMLASDVGDMAQSFAATLERHTGASYPVHKALAVCFDQWFRGETRVTLCDHQTLEYLDEVLRQYESGAIGKQKPQPIDVEMLSCLPDRTAYLQASGAEILRGPLYAGLTDPVNQSHFMQVMHDSSATKVQGVAFRDAGLAAKIFPGGRMTNEDELSEITSR